MGPLKGMPLTDSAAEVLAALVIRVSKRGRACVALTDRRRAKTRQPPVKITAAKAEKPKPAPKAKAPVTPKAKADNGLEYGARLRLQAVGVSRVYGNDGTPPWCTVTQASRFFSHRRDAVRLGSTGRMAAGWTYGFQKSELARTHPCLVAYEDLPPEQRAKDFLR